MQLSALKICDFFKFYAKNIRIRINFVILTLKLVQILVCELIRLKEKNEIIFANRFDRLRKLRNGINYYGKPVSQKVAEEALKEIKEMIKKLSKKYLDK